MNMMKLGLSRNLGNAENARTKCAVVKKIIKILLSLLESYSPICYVIAKKNCAEIFKIDKKRGENIQVYLDGQSEK